jgi:hypothetical protein
VRSKLTVTIDEDLIPEAKRQARSRKMSLSRLIETALRAVTSGESDAFSRRWRGSFRPARKRKDKRYAALAKKYL